VSFISIAETSCSIVSGMLVGSASMFSSRVTCSSTPPSFTPGDSSPPISSRVVVASMARSRRTPQEIHVQQASRHRVVLLVLDHHGLGRGGPRR